MYSHIKVSQAYDVDLEHRMHQAFPVLSEAEINALRPFGCEGISLSLSLSFETLSFFLSLF